HRLTHRLCLGSRSQVAEFWLLMVCGHLSRGQIRSTCLVPYRRIASHLFLAYNANFRAQTTTPAAVRTPAGNSDGPSLGPESVRAENLQSSMMPQFLDSFRAPSLLRLVLIWFRPEALLDQKPINFLPLR